MVYEIGFLGRVRIDAHSLNNEGTIGNVTEPRTVTLADGTKTDGISGEMLKHMHAESLWQIARDRKAPLCDACQKLSPMKADVNPKIQKGMKVTKALEEALKCTLCDIHGFLIQEPTCSRKSTVEFGWAIALPSTSHRDIHVHTRVAPGEKGRERRQEKEGEGEKTSEGPEQMIYNRPTRSGVYAIVSVFQPWRVGLNEVDYTYAINDEERKTRYEFALEAYRAMLVRLEGAMTTTRLPHLGGYDGAVVMSDSAEPVPMMSPLSDAYLNEVTAIAGPTNVHRFSSLEQLSAEIGKLKGAKPYKL